VSQSAVVPTPCLSEDGGRRGFRLQPGVRLLAPAAGAELEARVGGAPFGVAFLCNLPRPKSDCVLTETVAGFLTEDCQANEWSPAHHSAR
jgi:hypothetical protein